ncbi:hypothetical protein M6B38_362495 [Iris pallida]|uniref:Uncharacterized protein n=1 Tax=Iris pallida TaxID=29817 RepID=A0AAX6GIP4_IRIPA|nr:hypothetical protein M6B38_362495 [Iris pallida]
MQRHPPRSHLEKVLRHHHLTRVITTTTPPSPSLPLVVSFHQASSIHANPS